MNKKEKEDILQFFREVEINKLYEMIRKNTLDGFELAVIELPKICDN